MRLSTRRSARTFNRFQAFLYERLEATLSEYLGYLASTPPEPK